MKNLTFLKFLGTIQIKCYHQISWIQLGHYSINISVWPDDNVGAETLSANKVCRLIYRVFQKELYNFDGGGTIKKESKKRGRNSCE
jgi:hypothetical protein